MVEVLLRAWDGEELVVRHDRVTGTFMVVAVHSTALGPAMGGTRMEVYGSLERAVEDALRLASAMTLKQAAADLPFGGGKAVLAVPEIPVRGSARWRGLFERYGEMVEALGGRYVTAADMNTGCAELDVVGERTAHVLGRSPSFGGSGDAGADTALGVFHGIRASCAAAFGTADLAGRCVLVQGVGAVGCHLALLLRDADARVLVADIDAERAVEVASSIGASVVAPDAVVGTSCDVFAPCATGGVLSAATIPALRCRVVAGAANNQLEAAADADRLHEAGILYAPDHVINAGGVIHLAGYERLGWDRATVEARLAGIEDTLTIVFEVAERDGITTAAAAERLALAKIEAPRSGADDG